MAFITEEMIKQFQTQMEKIDEKLSSFLNVHNGYERETLLRFLKARDGNIPNAYDMLIDCLNWRIQNEIDSILAKPINPIDQYRAIRDSQLLGMSGYSKEGLWRRWAGRKQTFVVLLTWISRSPIGWVN